MVRSARPEPPPAAAPAARQALPEPPPARSAQPAPPARTNGSAASQDPRSTAGIERPRGVEDDRRPDRGRLAAREDAARDLVHDYLDHWSAPNPLTLAGSVDFYAPSVIFHGRAMSARALLEEKRRFVQRWPERRYRPRPETTGVACGPNGDTCTVRSVFDFTATDPERGRRSQGVATLELVVSFREDERPVITAENSLVHGRSRGSGFAAGGLDDEP
jgi:hypothetical protein